MKRRELNEREMNGIEEETEIKRGAVDGEEDKMKREETKQSIIEKSRAEGKGRMNMIDRRAILSRCMKRREERREE